MLAAGALTAAAASLLRLWRIQKHIGVSRCSDEEVVRSRLDVHKSQVVVHFVLALQDQGGSEINIRQSAMDFMLCWVDPDGGLHHFYKLRGQHVEYSWTGDSFVLFGVPQAKTEEVIDPSAKASSFYLKCGGTFPSKPPLRLPRHVDQLTGVDAERAGISLLCSYRIARTHPHQRILIMATMNGTRKCCVESGGVRAERWSGASDELAEAQQMSSDDEYRVIIRQPGGYMLPTSDCDWSVEYGYVCPPLPNSDTYDKVMHTFYVWGDMDFDDYGGGARASKGESKAAFQACKAVHPYKMNQIVPQTMIGRCLAHNDADYNPEWEEFETWVIQAQYYWQTDEGEQQGSKAMCGALVEVTPGDLIHTSISYSAADGTITATISSDGNVDGNGNNSSLPSVSGGSSVGRGSSKSQSHDESESESKSKSKSKSSSIVIERPFPNNSALFTSWRDFFAQCEAAERARVGDSTAGPLGRPGLNVEYKGRVDVPTLASVCPFVITRASFPAQPGAAAPLPTREWTAELFSPRTGSGLTLPSECGAHELKAEDATTGVALREFAGKGKAKAK